MAINLDLGKLKHNIVVVIVMLVFSSVIAPAWFIFQYIPDLFFKADVFRLIIICMGIGIGLNILNSLIMLVYEAGLASPKAMRDPTNVVVIANIESALVTTIVLYSPNLFTLFIHLSLKQASVISTVIEILILAIVIIFFLSVNKKKP